MKVIDSAVEGQVHLSGEQKEQLRQVLVRQHEAVSLGKSDMGRSAAVPHALRPKSEEPAYVKQFPIPAAHLHFINEQIDKLLALGAIKEDWDSPHNLPVFAVKKPHSNKLLFVIDMHKGNEIIWDDFHSFMDVNSYLQRLGGLEAKFLSALDLVNAYWQLELAEESQQYTSFTVPGRGKFVWTVTLMGLKTSPSAFWRLMEYVFQGFHNAVIYLDDVLIGSGTWESHMQHLDQALARMKRHNLKIGLRKCKFAEPSVEYLGNTINARIIKQGAEKTEAVRNFAPPQTVKEIRRFTRLCNYFRQFIRSYAGIAGKLTELTKKDSDWKGGPLPPGSQDAFEHLKAKLPQESILAFPKPGVPFVLATDASFEHGFGGILLQQQEEKMRVISYFSRALKGHERNYSAFLLEMAGAAQAIEAFHHYLYGVPLTLMCDHKPLERLCTVHKRTLLRLQELMGQYNFVIEYLPGKMNELADALSRTPNVCAISMLSGEDAVVKEQSRKGIIDGVDAAKWAEEQQKDGFCQAAWALCRKKNKSAAELARVEHYMMDRNVLFREVGRGNGMRTFGVVVPATMQYEILKAALASAFAGHKGAWITLQQLKEQFYWPGMGTDVKAFVAACKVGCAKRARIRRA